MMKFDIVGLFLIFLGLFGWVVAHKVRRKFQYRIKVVLVYSVPILIGFCRFVNICPDEIYAQMSLCVFILLITILYYREIQPISTREGYHSRIIGKFVDQIFRHAVYTKSPDLKFTYLNKASWRLFGKLTIKEAFDKTLTQVMENRGHLSKTCNIVDYMEASDTLTLKERKPVMVYEIGYYEGVLKCFHTIKTAIVSKKDGRITGLVCVSRDITKQYSKIVTINTLLCEHKYEQAALHFKEFTKYFGLDNLNRTEKDALLRMKEGETYGTIDDTIF